MTSDKINVEQITPTPLAVVAAYHQLYFQRNQKRISTYQNDFKCRLLTILTVENFAEEWREN
jgi:hypothetical protein